MGNESFFREGAPQRAHSRSSASLFEALQDFDLDTPRKPVRAGPRVFKVKPAVEATHGVRRYEPETMPTPAEPAAHPVAEVLDPPLLLTRRVDPDPHFQAWQEALTQARSGRKVAWIVATAMIVVCAAQAAAIGIMMPLKEVQPYTVLVDRQSGYVEVARGLQMGDLAEDQAVVHSMVAQYVMARETFDPADFKDRYERVALWSLDGARQSYVSQYQPGPGNMLAAMQPGAKVEVTVKNIELTEPGKARVRYELLNRHNGAPGERLDRQAVISYRFAGKPMRMEDRLLNPLGFQVTDFRSDIETAADAHLVSAPTAPDTAPIAPEMMEASSGAAPVVPPPGKVAAVLAPPAQSAEAASKQ